MSEVENFEEYLEEKAKILVNDYEGCYKHYEQVF